MQTKNKSLLSLSIVIYCFIFFLIYLLPYKPIENYTIVYVSSSVIFLFICWQIFPRSGGFPKNEISHNYFVGLLIVGFLLRISFISMQPIGSDDIYRYMWDGKVQAHGINPYLYSPNDSSLQSLHSEMIPKSVNFPEMKTIYFPLGQWLFYIAYSISGEAVWGYKLLLLIFELITFTAFFFLTKKIKLPSKYFLLYALCPLPIIQLSLDAHIDGFGLPLFVLSIFFYFDRKKILSLIFLGLSFSIKPVGLLFLPILFLYEKNFSDRVKIILIPFAAFFVQFIPYIFTSNPFESFFIYAKHWTFNGVVFSVLNSIIKNNQTTRIICGILLIISLLPLIFSKRESLQTEPGKDLVQKIYYSVLLLFIFSPVVHPWYIAWLVVLLPIFPRWSGIAYASLSSLTAFTILSYQLDGLWKEYPTVLILEYVPVIILLVYELTKKSFEKLDTSKNFRNSFDN